MEQCQNTQLSKRTQVAILLLTKTTCHLQGTKQQHAYLLGAVPLPESRVR